jgi:hypothetical protein
MTSTKPYIRKRAILLLYRVFLNNPEALKPAFPRLKEKLEDSDPGKLIEYKDRLHLLFCRCTSRCCECYL